eukprot:scaffold534674_cov18-Prasinocladus_malaysianus.AAC.1
MKKDSLRADSDIQCRDGIADRIGSQPGLGPITHHLIRTSTNSDNQPGLLRRLHDAFDQIAARSAGVL